MNNKDIHSILNMDYRNPYISIEDQTNLLINNIINKFCKEYGIDFGKKSFIVEYNDDCLSLITYRILVAIREITDLTFILVGKPKKTKNYIRKTERIMTKKQVYKLMTPQVFISCSHILYNIYNIERKNGDLFDNGISLIRRFTPDEIKTAMSFYGFKFNGEIRPNTLEWDGLNNYLNDPFNSVVPPVLSSLIRVKHPYDVDLVYIIDENETDCQTLQEVEQSGGRIYYFYKDESQMPNILKDINYAAFVANKTNIPCSTYGNLMIDKKWIDELWNNVNIKFVGPWPADKKTEVLNAI